MSYKLLLIIIFKSQVLNLKKLLHSEFTETSFASDVLSANPW